MHAFGIGTVLAKHFGEGFCVFGVDCHAVEAFAAWAMGTSTFRLAGLGFLFLLGCISESEAVETLAALRVVASQGGEFVPL
jgi:hypothetical protein